MKSSSNADGDLVEIGRIVNTHGIRGEVRLLPHNPDSGVWSSLDTVVLRGPGGNAGPRAIVSTRAHKKFVLVQFEGIGSINEAEGIVGSTVLVAKSCLPAISPGEVYHLDLIGCAVRTEAGDHLGTVREVWALGSNDVCAVDANGREHLIPLIEDVIVRIDVAGHEIVIRPIPGLLD